MYNKHSLLLSVITEKRGALTKAVQQAESVIELPGEQLSEICILNLSLTSRHV